MKKIITIICLLFIISGCNDEKIDKDQTLKPKTDEIKEELIERLELQSAISYNYKVNITVEDKQFLIQGHKYDNIVEGTFAGNKAIPFQCDIREGCYNLNTQEKDLLIFNDVNYSIITFSDMINKINSKFSHCDDSYKCTYNDEINTIEYIFTKSDLFLTNIKLIEKLNDYEDIYEIQYTNFNNTEIIKDKYHKHVRFDVDFKKTDKIKDIIQSNYHYFLYNISDVEFTLNSEKTYLDNDKIKTILDLAIDKVKYNDKVTKYIYEKDFVIYVKKIKQDKYDIYMSTSSNNAKIIELLLKA